MRQGSTQAAIKPAADRERRGLRVRVAKPGCVARRSAVDRHVRHRAAPIRGRCRSSRCNCHSRLGCPCAARLLAGAEAVARAHRGSRPDLRPRSRAAQPLRSSARRRSARSLRSCSGPASGRRAQPAVGPPDRSVDPNQRSVDPNQEVARTRQLYSDVHGGQPKFWRCGRGCARARLGAHSPR